MNINISAVPQTGFTEVRFSIIGFAALVLTRVLLLITIYTFSRFTYSLYCCWIKSPVFVAFSFRHVFSFLPLSPFRYCYCCCFHFHFIFNLTLTFRFFVLRLLLSSFLLLLYICRCQNSYSFIIFNAFYISIHILFLMAYLFRCR